MADSCVFNMMVDCPVDGRKCNKCGWNPEVNEKRKKPVGLQRTVMDSVWKAKTES